MNTTLTVRDLLQPGEPLDSAEVVACPDQLTNSVTWAVSLRPYPPAFPRLRTGEFVLVATEYLARLDPPTTLAAVLLYLASRDVAGVAVRGEIDEAAIRAARDCELPLLRLKPDSPMHDIEQAVVRACALFQARREMQPFEHIEDPGAWLDRLLSGRIVTLAEAQAEARRQGAKLATHYTVAFIKERRSGIGGREQAIEGLIAQLRLQTTPNGFAVLVREQANGLAVMLPQGIGDNVLSVIEESGLPCGIGSAQALLDLPASLEDAGLAATASALLRGGNLVRYDDMGADRLLVLLHKDHPNKLRTFVEETIGPLLKYDEDLSTPVLPTLRTFIEHGGRLRETATKMFVHRNTLAYRLQRVEEILGVDLKDADARLAIELALKALPLVSDQSA